MTFHASLHPQCLVKQDHFEQLTIHCKERNASHCPQRTLAECYVYLLADKAAPGLCIRATVQPPAHVQQHCRSQQRRDALGEFTVRTRDIDHVACHRPGDDTQHHRTDPARMDVGQSIAPSGLDDKGDNGRQYQDRLQPLTQQDQQ